jgi:hypothetical protein
MNKVTLEEVFASIPPETLIPHPGIQWDAATLAACERLYRLYVEPARNEWIPDEAIDVPKWVFLEYLGKRCPVLLHGSQADDIEEFTPWEVQDNIVGSERPRINASSNGLFSMFYALLDRDRLMELVGYVGMEAGWFPYEDVAGQHQEGFLFGLDYRALPHAPWKRGVMYVLPRATFVPEYREIQWLSFESVRPMARLRVDPQDWPLLSQVREKDFMNVRSAETPDILSQS